MCYPLVELSNIREPFNQHNPPVFQSLGSTQSISHSMHGIFTYNLP